MREPETITDLINNNENMKLIKNSLLAACLFMAAPVLQSCSDDDGDNYGNLMPSAVVTVKPQTDGQFIMQLDNKTILQPTNMKTSPFGEKEVRALVNYTETVVSEVEGVRNVKVNWIDSIRTKKTVLNLGEENDAKYGNDPLEIVNDWLTVAEDGYLTLRFRTLWGYGNVRHSVNLLTNVNPENPYELELRHNANGDWGGNMGDALIAFNLKDLPVSDGNNIKIKLNWKSFSGDKSAEFELYVPAGVPDPDAPLPAYSGCVK